MHTNTDPAETSPDTDTAAPAPAPAPDVPLRYMHKTHPHFIRTCGRAAWFTWALGQFNLFESAPTPALDGLDAVAKGGELSARDFPTWVEKFLRWCRSGAGSTRTRSVALFLLHAYNLDIKLRGAEPIEVAFGGMDNVNRAAVVTVLSHWRTF